MRSLATREAVLLASAVVAGLVATGPVSAVGGAEASPRVQTTVSDAPSVTVDPGYDGPTTAGRGPATAQAAAYPLDRTFLLHSKPGARRTVHIDFDGTATTGAAWNLSGALPGWSLDASSDFSATELTAVQAVWQQVAEDYAPFDVDVTTQDPGPDAITRSNAADQVFGARAVITGSRTRPSSADNSLCAPVACGGIAFNDVFDRSSSHADYQPAFVFPEHLGDDTKAIAEGVSHEVGHNLGLDHDGTAGQEYYGGHGAWGPIMGAPYQVPITQWSRGEYAGADEAEDDLAMIASGGAPLRADAVGGTVTTAAPLPGPTGDPASTGLIESRTDVDVFALGTCSGSVRLTATPSAVDGPNLDVALALLDANGAVLATDAPASAKVSRTVASGLGAAITYNAGTGRVLFASVDGGGAGSPTAEGYSDYGSLGRYTLTATRCAPTAGAPSAPRSVTATVDGSAVTVRWAAPATGTVAGYAVTANPGDDTQDVPASGTSAVFGALAPGTAYTFSVVARAANGATSPPGTATVTTPAAPPGAVASLGATATSAGVVTLSWTPPDSDGGSFLTGYRLQLGALTQDVGESVRAATVDGLAPGASYTATVSALNSVGAGSAVRRTFAVPVLAASAPALRVLSASGIRGSARVGARLTVRPGTWSVPVTLGYRWFVAGKPVAGARKASYRPTARQLGKRITARVTASAPGYRKVVSNVSSRKVRR